MNQNLVAFGLVGVASGWIAWRVFVKFLAPLIANFLLKRGHVRLAMKLKHLGRKSCC